MGEIKLWDITELVRKVLRIVALVFILFIAVRYGGKMADSYLANLIDSLIWRESKGDPKAISSVGARGLGQIMPSVLTDYNKTHKTNYTSDDLFDPTINRNITIWHFTNNLPMQLANKGMAPTLEALLGAYNVGAKGLVRGDKPAKRYIVDILNRAGVIPPEYTAE